MELTSGRSPVEQISWLLVTEIDEALEILIDMAPGSEASTNYGSPERGEFYRELSQVLAFLARCYEQANQ